MSSPISEDVAKLRRVARYLINSGRLVQIFKWQEDLRFIKVYTDSDWAGDSKTAKSTSGGCVMYGEHLWKSWASTQQVIATSSGEAELYAVTKGAAQAMGMVSMSLDFGDVMTATVACDANAAIGIAHRQGLGKLRHINVQYLWLQEKVADKEMKIEKVGANDNLADLLTKALNEQVSRRHLSTMGIWTSSGRAKSQASLKRITKLARAKVNAVENVAAIDGATSPQSPIGLSGSQQK